MGTLRYACISFALPGLCLVKGHPSNRFAAYSCRYMPDVGFAEWRTFRAKGVTPFEPLLRM
jgi:hypothetical protein